MPLSSRFGTRLLLALALTAPTACDMFMKPGPSAVAQGRYYSTGNPEYDAFFVELHRLQVELKDAPDRAAEPRAALAKTLDVGLDADVIKEALGKKASELNSRQIKVTVLRPATPDKPATLRVTGNPAGDDAALTKTLEDQLTKIAELTAATASWQKDLDPLPEREATLESGVDTAFADKPPRTRSEVRSNLGDARKVIELLVSRAKDTEHANGELFDAITGALGETTPAGGEKSPEPATSAPPASSEKKGHKDKAGATAKSAKPAKASKPEPAPKPTKTKPPKPEPATPKHAAPSPEPKPVPKPAPPPPKPPEPKPAAKPEPKPAPEVPPPPKPTQGTAKPDFEP
jgi:hypothetical protein